MADGSSVAPLATTKASSTVPPMQQNWQSAGFLPTRLLLLVPVLTTQSIVRRSANIKPTASSCRMTVLRATSRVLDKG